MSEVNNFKINNRTQEGDCCPECKTSWDGGDILEDATRRKDASEPMFDMSDTELIEYAEAYGWTPEDKRRWGNLIGMELSYDDPEHYDGVSYWACPECGVAWCRWTGDRTDRFVSDVKLRNLHIEGGELTKDFKLEGFDLTKEDKKHI